MDNSARMVLSALVLLGTAIHVEGAGYPGGGYPGGAAIPPTNDPLAIPPGYMFPNSPYAPAPMPMPRFAPGRPTNPSRPNTGSGRPGNGRPNTPNTPNTGRPNTGRPGNGQPNRPQTNVPNTPQPGPTAPQTGAGAPPALSGAGQGSSGIGSGLAGGGAGAQAGLIGRLDASNRLNIFDNQSAIPASRMWIGYQFAESQDNSIFFVDRPAGVAVRESERNNLHVLRTGVEVAVNCWASISVQGQYVDPVSSESFDLEEGWTDPQILFKHIVYQGAVLGAQSTLVSATLGSQIEVGTSPRLVDNQAARIYPGFLFYNDYGWVNKQGGVQIGIPFEADPATIDWSYAAGFWLYRARSDFGTPFITGLLPQISIMGKHVIGDNDVDGPFGLGFDQAGGFGFVLEENRHVVDVTLGVNVLMGEKTSANLGFSFPITGAEQRRAEFIFMLNRFF